MPSRKRSERRKASRQREGGSSAAGFLRRNARSFAAVALLGAVVAAAWVVLDPFAAPTAIDANGDRVSLGPIDDNPDARPRAGAPAPNFLLADYDGNAVRLSDFRGKVVYLNFWATWCTACEAEMPDMNVLAQLHPEDLVVVAVNRGEGKRQAKDWSDARNLENLVFLIDPRESISGTYRLPNAMPVSFFIDATGKVTRVVPSAQNLAQMEQYYDEAKLSSGLGVAAAE